jgi:hypothetical protein
MVHANVVVDGQLVRVQLAAAFFHEASWGLRKRLSEKLADLERRHW